MKLFAKTTSILFLILFAVFSWGCAHVVEPHGPCEIGTGIRPLQTGYSVQLINNQPDTTRVSFASAGIHTYLANYNEWTQYYIDQLSNELTKRNVVVSNKSPNAIRITLSQFLMARWTGRGTMTIKLETADGRWFKVYEESETSAWVIETAFNGDVCHSIEMISNDPEVLEKMHESAAEKK